MLVVLDAATFGHDIDHGLLTRDIEPLEIYDLTKPEETASRIKDATIVVTNKVVVDGSHMASAPGLKLIALAATGTDNVDLEAAKAAGITVCNVPDYSTEPVAAHTFALYFQLAHHMSYHNDYVQMGAWSSTPVFTALDNPWQEPASLVFGVVGMGHIGQRVAALAKAFGFEVCYHSTSGRNTSHPYRHCDLESLLTEADVVSLHCPLNDKTREIINSDGLARMKRSAILINTARGGLIDTSALARALEAGDIGGAALDVMPVEPPPADHPLFCLKQRHNLVMTPHIAGLSTASRIRLLTAVRQNIEAFEAGKPTNRV